MRILADEARRGLPTRRDALAAALRLAGALDLGAPPETASAIEANAALRFALDSLLRTILWAPSNIASATRKAWEQHLAHGSVSALFRTLSRGSLRTHPTELIARHAGEISAKVEWFELAITLSEEAPRESTIAAMGVFTRMLMRGEAPTGPEGCQQAPVFEYR